MRPDIHKEITTRLQANFGLQASGQWLNSGKCPQCQKRELYAAASNPWVVKCGRLNKCGYEAKIRDLFPDIFANFNQRYKSTKAKPTTTADAYLEIARGLDPAKLKGWYTQGHFEHPHGDHSTATVRFAIARDVTMERLIEPVTTTDPDTGEKNTRKAQFRGSFKGKVWTPPKFTVKDGDEIWIVEGCLDAAALSLVGIKAVACLTCYNYPAELFKKYAGKKVRWIWALDNDPKGRQYLVKGVKRGRDEGLDVAAACIATKRGKIDWNDAWQQGLLDEHFVADCRHHGDLLTAASHREKAELIYTRHGSPFFCFEFANRMYGFEIDTAALNKAMEGGETISEAVWKVAKAHEIANFAVEFQYFKRNEITDESWYSAQIRFPHKGQAIRCDFTGAQIATAPEFKKRAMSVAPGAVFTGKATHLDWLSRQHLFNIKTVQTIDFIGYSKEHQAYIFDQAAFANGTQYAINDRGYFDLGKSSITTLQKSVTLDIASFSDDCPEWIEHFWTAFGAKGVIVLAFWFGTLFAEQIRQHQASFPFLEVIGEPGSGKTSLIEFLWKLLGRADEEGFDPAKATAAAAARKFAQVSNLPIVLIEADREADTSRSRKFDWEETKPLYNGRGTRSRGVKNSGNETYDPPFRGALVVTQNDAVAASPAVMQRFMHIEMTRANHTPASKQSIDYLNLTKVRQVSHFIAKALTREKKIWEIYQKAFHAYEAGLISDPDIKNIRIAKNHAQLFGLAEGLFGVIPFSDAQQQVVREEIKAMAIERQHAIGGDHPVVEAFWEVFEYLQQATEKGLNHSRKEGFIAINLNEFIDFATSHRQEIPSYKELKKHLRNGSKSRPLLKSNHSVNSRTGKPTLRCWVFRDLPESAAAPVRETSNG